MYLQVVAAVIKNDNNRILVAQRNKNSHQGGLWEFPGGKVESEESSLDALKREIYEELDLCVIHARPLIKVHHHYSDKSVCLDVWLVDKFEGEARGKEGQPIEWVTTGNLKCKSFPEANKPILKAISLPNFYCITPDFSSCNPSVDELERFYRCLFSVISNGYSFIQFRAPTLDKTIYLREAKKILALCQQHNAELILNGDATLLTSVDAAGIHLSSDRLLQAKRRPVGDDKWLGASCHTIEELKQAQKIGCDFACLSPVNATLTHPNAAPMGWSMFNDYVQHMNIPVYGLGGVGPNDIHDAWAAGAQGVAGIRGFWPAANTCQ